MEIEAKQVIGKDHQELSSVLKKQYRKLILVHHPDKGGNEERFKNLDEACKELNAYIEPLKSGDRCVKISVDAESDGHLTAREFYYRKKLFEKLNITEEEVRGRNFAELASILEKKSSSLIQDLQHQNKLIHYINSWTRYSSLFDDKVKELRNELDEHLLKPNIQLFSYSTSRNSPNRIRYVLMAMVEQ
ncbi:DnaJ domain-containing protein, partial [Wolbachia endosymbiont of Drosophila bicornuta]|uniref:DnaJ domain-containing protein n=1 Tax=Wolbachia TaxID=953 RepID=UPI0015FC2068|nr:DnaJ domain-containing protein [Wolbachia endosymbiont of Drosophila bicornuta]MBA8755101.1 DnaJ domain-containing protein [Wolbachia pipientis]MDE5056118.1 DnaJ domain-containing protein [Wolbachia endosymbiont of Drosophila bicornuta]